MSRKRAYVAGPISLGDLQDNVDRARQAGIQLMKLGFAPLVPHLSVFMGGNTMEVLPCGTEHSDWIGIDLPWVEVADAVLRLAGESRGADMEEAHAREKGIPVFYSIPDLVAHFA
jgi:hypothetical protein